jgi:GNAT superfamily N-acetyltransferase
MTTTRLPFTTRPYTAADEQAVLTLLRQALGENATRLRVPEVWKWKHIDNPFGPSFLRVACSESNRIVGLRAFMQWRFDVGGAVIRAVQAVDTATAPDFRRMGIFSALTRQAIEDARSDGVSLIYNTPNMRARPGYLRLGWQYVGTVQPLVRLLDLPGWNGRVRSRGAQSVGTGGDSSPNFFRAPIPGAKEAFDETESIAQLLEQASTFRDERTGFRTSLSVEYARWRYTSYPGITYRAIRNAKAGQLRGCAIFRVGQRLGLREALLSELWVAEPDDGLYTELLEELKASVRANYILAYAPRGSFLYQALRRSGFRPVPTILMSAVLERAFVGRQKPRRLVVLPLASDLPVDPLLLENWAFSLGDLEIF